MLKVLSFVPGLLTLGFGGYLAAMDKPYGWFLGLGALLSLCALGSTMPTPPEDDEIDLRDTPND